MAIFVLIALVALLIIGFSAYAISEKAYRSLLKKNENTALMWSVLIFIATFGLILLTLIVILLSNVGFGR